MSESTANHLDPAAEPIPAAGRHARTGPAKFLRPRTPAGAVQRDRLVHALDTNLAAPLTLIVGPAGYGKSTLVTQWLSRTKIRHAWLFADEHDADPATFMRSLIQSVARTDPTLAPRAAALLQDERAPFQQLLVELVDELSRIEPPFALVIDDYQRAHSTETDSLLGMFLRSLGATPSLLIISRSTPHLPLDVLNAYGEVMVLDAADLRFSPDESRALLRQNGSSQLAVDVIDRIVDQADGWAVALRLLSASAPLADTFAEPIDADSHHSIGPDVSNYLFSEVIELQSEETQDFLVRTAILEFLRPAFCDALTDRNDSRELLDRLVEADVFTHLLDRDDRSYRYHPLFRDALLLRQEQTLTTS